MSYRRYYFDFAAALGTLWLLFLPLALLAGQWDTFNAGLMAIVPLGLKRFDPPHFPPMNDTVGQCVFNTR